LLAGYIVRRVRKIESTIRRNDGWVYGSALELLLRIDIGNVMVLLWKQRFEQRFVVIPIPLRLSYTRIPLSYSNRCNERFSLIISTLLGHLTALSTLLTAHPPSSTVSRSRSGF